MIVTGGMTDAEQLAVIDEIIALIERRLAEVEPHQRATVASALAKARRFRSAMAGDTSELCRLLIEVDSAVTPARGR